MPVRGTPLSLIDWQVLAEVEVASDCDYVDFTGLDINRDWEYYLDVTIKNPSGTKCDYFLFVEGDYTLENYNRQFLRCDGTSVSGVRDVYTSIGFAPPYDRFLSNVRITRDPDGYARFTSICNRYTGSVQHFTIYACSKTAPISNITSLRVSAEVSGAIGAGSKFILARPRS